MKKTLILMLLCFNFLYAAGMEKSDSTSTIYTSKIDYELLVDEIITQIIGLKADYRQQLSNIENAKIERSITKEKFWIGFHSVNSEWIQNPTYKKGKKNPKWIQTGIELHLYFYSGEWQAQAEVCPIALGDINIVIFIKNDTHNIYEKIMSRFIS